VWAQSAALVGLEGCKSTQTKATKFPHAVLTEWLFPIHPLSLPCPHRFVCPFPTPRDAYCHCFYKPYRIPEVVPSSTVRSQSQPPTHSCGTLRTRRLVVNVPESDSSKLVPRWLEQIVSERAPSLPLWRKLTAPTPTAARAHTH
jgi:hypothetical protein